MTRPERGSDSVMLQGGALGELTFDWNEDRYEHRWKFPDSDIKIASVESDNTELWPLSPPLQQIHQQSFGDGREVIFGVGMAGRGHWSASFTLVPELKCWIVELACRSTLQPERLISSYQVASTIEPTGQDQLQLSAADGSQSASSVKLEAIAPSTLVTQVDGVVSFSPSSITFGDTPTQWAFRVRVC